MTTFGGAVFDADGRPFDDAAATLGWALGVERVSRIVVTGHAGCRAPCAGPAAVLAQLRALRTAARAHGEVAVLAWWLDDADGGVAEWSPRLERFVGLDAAELARRLAELREARPRGAWAPAWSAES